MELFEFGAPFLFDAPHSVRASLFLDDGYDACFMQDDETGSYTQDSVDTAKQDDPLQHEWLDLDDNSWKEFNAIDEIAHEDLFMHTDPIPIATLIPIPSIPAGFIHAEEPTTILAAASETNSIAPSLLADTDTISPTAEPVSKKRKRVDRSETRRLSNPGSPASNSIIDVDDEEYVHHRYYFRGSKKAPGSGSAPPVAEVEVHRTEPPWGRPAGIRAQRIANMYDPGFVTPRLPRCSWDYACIKSLYDFFSLVEAERGEEGVEYSSPGDMRHFVVKNNPGCALTAKQVQNKKMNLLARSKKSGHSVTHLLRDDIVKWEERSQKSLLPVQVRPPGPYKKVTPRRLNKIRSNSGQFRPVKKMAAHVLAAVNFKIVDDRKTALSDFLKNVTTSDRVVAPPTEEN
jgi:hypothetical protein